MLTSLEGFTLAPQALEVIPDARGYRTLLLQRIATAQRRIVLVALYLQEDEAGQEILDALYEAKAGRPTLDIVVVVDWFRAQRGLMGAGKQPGNAAWYQALRQRHGLDVPIHGVPVQTRELFGVLHLKGSIIDDEVIYTGASLNNVYLHRFDKYRLDRYHVLDCRPLADSMVALVRQVLAATATHRLDAPELPTTRDLRDDIRSLRARLKDMRYDTDTAIATTDHLRVTPVLGIGRHNPLNRLVCELLAASKERITLCTPYFNPPKALLSEIERALARGVQVDVIVGDKLANDFYVPPEQPFSASAVLPYLYETNLRSFARRHGRAVAQGRLNLFVWNDPGHSFHAKGIWIDQRYTLLTGNNLNPRGFSLDLENALLIDDPRGQWLGPREAELAAIREHVHKVTVFSELDSARTYPAPVRRFLRRLRYTRFERLVKRML
ncbi:CDP-diacylglycerol--serine O-phosphatidyltransferase [Pseudomonas capeferrum]|uniref:CDP-diacylglycerol--serine O-phosphatidyltransferase n=1 Tax=Pseudomonas capeferrum TaxID=1495066 RepID=UPI0015E3E65D|nr:CDP-diacylglycerol--serine O-phosphatidyltransferase [Pseudomonas capeferrum]MBA1200257.1 CDP-diacylglycerol--serine O-phosphatidyltransferase [Pseudomonas capeferrum]